MAAVPANYGRLYNDYKKSFPQIKFVSHYAPPVLLELILILLQITRTPVTVL